MITVLPCNGAPPLPDAATAVTATFDAGTGLALSTTTNTSVPVGLAAAPVATTVTPAVATAVGDADGELVALSAGARRAVGEAAGCDEHPDTATVTTTAASGQGRRCIS